VGAEAGFHADNARRQSSEFLNERQPLDLARKSNLAVPAAANKWKTSFPMSMPIEASSVVG
jgi:hypothetical protein